MDYVLIFFWMQIPSFILALSILAGFFGVLAIACAFNIPSKPYYADVEATEEKAKAWINAVKKWAIRSITTALFAVLFPSQLTIAAMVGTYYTKEAVNSVEGQKVVTLIRKKANEFLDAELKK